MTSPNWHVNDRTLRRSDAAAAAWIITWLVVGLAVAYEIWRFTALSESTIDSGQALARAGEGLSGLADVPVIGPRTGELGDQVTTTAEQIVTSGQEAGASIRGLSVLFGLAVALIPTGSALFLYLPYRRRRNRDTAAIVTALRRDGLSPRVTQYLADRAVAHVPADILLASSGGNAVDPEHQTLHLANAELARLGISPSKAG
ncbi:MAG TPA: hypothetical protein VMX11_01575 [Actinomycetes bacterium]|nr:hypothetical protein [Actinomycetes bacterium]